MKYKIFDFKCDTNYIDSFLESASLAHKEPKKTLDWFYWKFRDNPFGKTILACAEDDGKIVGCVAYGIQYFSINESRIKGALAFENFVHPNFQGKGIFKNLIKLSESESINQNIKFLLVFPNYNSLPGYQRVNWIKLKIPEYWIKGKYLSTVFLSFKELKKRFIPNGSNLENLDKNIFDGFIQFKKDQFASELNPAYLYWRFLTFPIAEYVIINDKDYCSVGRVGWRGKLKEVQVLFINPNSTLNFSLKKVLKAYQIKSQYDIISFPISGHNQLRKELIKKLFLKVPNHTNMCYKLLDDSLKIDLSKLALNAINYHTY